MFLWLLGLINVCQYIRTRAARSTARICGVQYALHPLQRPGDILPKPSSNSRAKIGTCEGRILRRVRPFLCADALLLRTTADPIGLPGVAPEIGRAHV